jgi:hypothetical protein
MPAWLGPCVGFVLGAAFAYLASETLAKGVGSGVSSRALILVSVFSVLVYAPVCAYFLAFSPDWAYAYLIDSKQVPRILGLGLILGDCASVPLGFAVSMRRARTRQIAWVARLALIGVVVSLASVLPFISRLAVQATFAQFHGDFGVRRTAGSELGFALLWMLSILVASVAWTVRALRRLAS